MSLLFSKYQGTGNDFILIDNRAGAWDRFAHKTSSPAEGLNELVARMCDRRFGIGADGLILLNAHPTYDFEMHNFNSDGSESTMCGNGARTLVQFALDLGLKPREKNTFKFLATDGEHEARVSAALSGSAGAKQTLVHVKMQDVARVDQTPHGFFANTGSPHLVCLRDDVTHYPVYVEGKKLRHDAYFPHGTNVNFVRVLDQAAKKIQIRTFERGVEDETLSCGTGVIAAALSLFGNTPDAHTHTTPIRVEAKAQGGTLSVEFEKSGPKAAPGSTEASFKNIWLIGPAEKTFSGEWTFHP